MNDLTIRTYAPQDEDAVVELWHKCDVVVPWNDPKSDIRAKTEFQPDLFLVGKVDGTLVATVMVGYEGHRGWINYLAVDPSMQRQGIGTRMMQRAEQLLKALGCPKINIQVRATNAQVLAFYEKLGYMQDPLVDLGKRLGNT
jgi:ribosomal protein S18 acetylase RimI-like enzyme